MLCDQRIVDCEESKEAQGALGEDEKPPVICIVGPTASGKTDLAQLLAHTLHGEVVSADSMQIYRGMDIGTGKLSRDERTVAHYGIDLCDPGAYFSAALFQSYARSCFTDIYHRSKVPILCGGTGLYIRAAIDDYEFPKGEQHDNPVRERWTNFAEKQGARALWEELHHLDPASAVLIHHHNVRRVIRAFELLEEGTTYATQHAQLQVLPQAVPAVFFGLEVTPSVLAARIDTRVEAMLSAGLVDEVASLLEQGYSEGVTAHQAIGYKEIAAVLDGKVELSVAVEQVKTATRRYAKRQRTWFRKDSRITWLHADSGDTEQLAEQVLAELATMEIPYFEEAIRIHGTGFCETTRRRE